VEVDEIQGDLKRRLHGGAILVLCGVPGINLG
jgi:hypothetical protein